MGRKQLNEAETLREERDVLRRRVDELERLVARVEPEAIIAKLPEPLEKFSNNVPAKILALSVTGLATSELRAELGMSREQQTKWSAEHATFAAALLRGKDLARAYWQRLSRQALENKDWKSPYSQAQRFVETMLSEEDEPRDLGDASTLICMDLAECPDCGYCAEESARVPLFPQLKQTQ